MASETSTKGLEREIGNFAVGCVAYLVTQSGYIWRELPGSDIGIDGEIEIVKKDHQPGVKLLVQVKGTAKKDVSARQIRVNESRSHWEYWRTQRNPVLVCEVQIEKGERDHPYKATQIRWVDIARVPTDSLSSNSSIPFHQDDGIQYLFSKAADKHVDWRTFIDDVVRDWPTRRIDAANQVSTIS